MKDNLQSKNRKMKDINGDRTTANITQAANIDIEEILYAECCAPLPESAIINHRLEAVYAQIRQGRLVSPSSPASVPHSTQVPFQRKTVVDSAFFHHLRRVTVAACLLLVIGLGVGIANPAIAAEIPVVGKIFSYLEEKVSFPGNYSEHATPIEEIGAAIPSAQTDKQSGSRPNTSDSHVASATPNAAAFTQTDAGLSVTITEVSSDSNGLYAAIRLENEEGFPSDFLEGNAMTDPSDFLCICSAVVYDRDGSSTIYSQESGHMVTWKVEGVFQDEKTFLGMAMLEFPDASDCTKIEITFSEFSRDLLSTHEIVGHVAGEASSSVIAEPDKKLYQGSWKFVLLPENIIPAQEYAVNQTNEQGLGIQTVVKNLYEIYAVPIYPEGKTNADYVVTIWDADGKPLESHGSNAETYATYGHNLDKITIYILDYTTYMDEAKGNGVYLQPEKALYSVEVSLS